MLVVPLYTVFPYMCPVNASGRPIPSLVDVCLREIWIAGATHLSREGTCCVCVCVCMWTTRLSEIKTNPIERTTRNGDWKKENNNNNKNTRAFAYTHMGCSLNPPAVNIIIIYIECTYTLTW